MGEWSMGEGSPSACAAPRPTRPGPPSPSASPPPTRSPTAPPAPLDAVHACDAGTTNSAPTASAPAPPGAASTATAAAPAPDASNPKPSTSSSPAAGLDGDYGGYSLRRGFATSALAGDANERAVQRHGRWSSPNPMTPYIDEATRYANTNPTRHLI